MFFCGSRCGGAGSQNRWGNTQCAAYRRKHVYVCLIIEMCWYNVVIRSPPINGKYTYKLSSVFNFQSLSPAIFVLHAQKLRIMNMVMGVGMVWLGVMVKALACDSRGREFNSRPSRCQATTFGKLFTHTCLCYQAVNLVPVARKRCPVTGKVTVSLASALAMRHRLKWFIHLRPGLRLK